ncbi:ABC transporter ATP-binding protein [Roseicitreum antarcticum]|uniref:Peptide/nickel transport system ATP-binding protein n=1 Tax=Roseicitreum antarcticum TaxID=564137 RepID=A0A1H2TNK7_9RHOB|nr:ABC transporter ATP-binding protein [Roseicitreum antarcticum]SDW45533.1 peptide/nickel transport system ATP-binding protein [Roseicitreum antarcticum]
MPLIDVENLTVRLPVPAGMLHAVQGLSFRLDAGEALGIVGESGSGKSMTALALMRLLPRNAQRSADRMHLGGQDLLAMSDRAFADTVQGTRIGMIFQEPMTSLNPVYTIGRQMTEASLRLGRLTSRAAHARAVSLLDRVGIPDPGTRMGQYPHQMSGGQRQRVMIAMALMLEPEVLIADEPTTALDVTVQAQIMALLADLRQETGMAMILISHDLAVVSQATDRVAVMYSGEMVEAGRAAAVLANARHPYTGALLRAIPTIDGPRHRLAAIPGTVAAQMTPPTACVFAPRCADAQPVCTQAQPPVRGDADHWARCILTGPGETALGAAKALPAATENAATADLMIEARDILKLYQMKDGLFGRKKEIRAVDHVSLDVRRGETLALVGESGSGKSTLARILLGLIDPTAGEVLLQGQPIAGMADNARAKLVQPIFQDPYSSLNPRRTVAEIIARPLDLRGVDAAERMRRARDMMDLVRLPTRLLHSYPLHLSGGQRQRVAIARAMINDPEVLICDEPTSALDVSVQAQILNLLSDLQEEFGLTTLIITHDMAVVHQLANRVAVLLQGQLVEEGSAADVLARPKADYTRMLLNAAPRFDHAALQKAAPL